MAKTFERSYGKQVLFLPYEKVLSTVIPNNLYFLAYDNCWCSKQSIDCCDMFFVIEHVCVVHGLILIRVYHLYIHKMDAVIQLVEYCYQ